MDLTTVNNHDDEEDYMSDKFIMTTSGFQSSLLHSHKLRYEHERYKRKLESNLKSKRSIKDLEEQQRQAGLAEPLNPENKGFRLFKKMISASRINQESNLETNVKQLVSERQPIEIKLKIGREGLGHKCKRSKVEIPKLKDIKIDQDKFLRYKIEKSESYMNKKDYFQLQKICFNLDSNKSIDKPFVEWYWPSKLAQGSKKVEEDQFDDEKDSSKKYSNEKERSDVNADETEEEKEIDYKLRIDQINYYIRSEYFYCFWCGCLFQSLEDLQQNCPGNTRDLH